MWYPGSGVVVSIPDLCHLSYRESGLNKQFVEPALIFKAIVIWCLAFLMEHAL